VNQKPTGQLTKKLDKEGRVTIPTVVRQLVGLEDGGTVQIQVEGRKVILSPANPEPKGGE